MNMTEIIEKLDLIISLLNPALIDKFITIGAPIISSFIAVLIAYGLDKKSENKMNKDEFLKNTNFLLVKNELNIRSLLSLKSEIELRLVTKKNEKSFISLPKQFSLTSLTEIDINEMKLMNVDSNMTSLIFEFREIKPLIENELIQINDQVSHLEEISKNETIYLSHFDKYNSYLSHVRDNVNAFLIRLVELNTHILGQAYQITKKRERKNIYEVHVDNKLIELVENKLDNEFLKNRYLEIEYLHRKNKLEKSFKGMERKDILIRVMLGIVKKKHM